MGFKEISKSSLAEKIILQMITMIKNRELQPGEKLPAERDLAQTLNVSRPSLREALRALSILGVVEIQQGNGAYIAEIGDDEVAQTIDLVLSLKDPLYIEVLECRKVVESGIVAMAIQKITDEQIEELDWLVAKLEANLEQSEEFIATDLAIHDFFIRVAANNLLEVFMNSIVRLGKASRQRTTPLSGVPQMVVSQHKKILEAVKRRDSVAAVSAMEEHLGFLENKLAD